MRLALLDDLARIGYEVFLEGSNIRYRYPKEDDPHDTAQRLLHEF